MKPACKGPGMVVLGLLVLLAAGLAAAPEAQAFSYRKPITIDRTKVGVSGTSTPTLTDYPFLYDVTDANLKTIANGGHVTNGTPPQVNTVNSVSASTSSPVDVTHTISGTNTLLLVGISAGGTIPTVSSVVWDATGAGGSPQPLTQVGTTANGTTAVVWIYRLTNPRAGTFTMRATFTGSTATVAVGVISFTGVNQTTPLGLYGVGFYGAYTDPTGVNPQSWTGELAFDVIALNALSIGSASGSGTQTARWTGLATSNGVGAASTEPGAPAVRLGYGNSSDNQYAAGAVSIKPVSGNAEGDDITFRAFDADNPGLNICGAGVDVCTLDHEVELYDPTTGRFVAWVRIPVLQTQKASNTYNTKIYIYYGDSGIQVHTAVNYVDDGSGRFVWDTNFKGVWHMNQDPFNALSYECSGASSARVICDSTYNNNDAQPFTFSRSSVMVLEPTAKIGMALDFDGGSDRMEVPSPVLPTGDFTWSTWAIRDSTSTVDAIVFINTSEFYWKFPNSNAAHQTTTSGTTNVNATTANGIVAHYLTWTRSGSTITVYFDGVSQATGSDATALSFGACQLLIGASATTCNTTITNWFNGKLDELRISNIARSADWVITEYNNGNAPTAFCTPTCGTTTEEGPNAPSLVRFTKAHALAYDGVQNRVVHLQWRTSYEVDHLGFHVYREQNGQRLQVTPALIAGSALKARAGTVLTAGQSYSWWDVLPAGGGPLAYWLEEIDLHGQRTWHGPVQVESAKGHRLAAEPERVRSVLLTRMGRGKASVTAVPWYGTRPALLAPVTPTPEQLAVQWRLAAGRAVKLGVQAEGWYHVSQADLVAAGLDARVNPRQLHLYADGVEVPLLVIGEQDGRFDPSDAIEFYGLGLDTPWTDTRTYWLVAESREGQRVSWAPSRPGGAVAPLSFPSTLEWRPRNIYFAALLNGEADNYFGPVVGNWPLDQDFTLAQLDPSPSGEGRLEVTLQGLMEGRHQVEVRLNGSPVGTVSFEGLAQGTTQVRLSPAYLLPGANRVTLEAQGGELDYSLVASVRLTYWRFYQAEADLLEAAAPGGDQVTISGFSSAQIRVLDVTQPDAVQALPGRVKRERSGFAVTVVAPGSGSRTLLAFTDGHRASPAFLRLHQPSQWHASGPGADLVILTHGSLLPSLASLQAWRQQQGWAVALIDVQEVYDEFSFGAKSPWALRAFLQQARRQWARPPRFLLLAGDASVDPRNFMEMGDMDFVPTKLVDTQYLETASDDWFGDLDGDGVPEIAVGRLAVQTREQADAVVRKLIDYDRAGAGGRAAVLVADRNDGFDFEGASGQVKALLPTGVTVEEIYRGQLDDASAHAALLASLNAGPWFLNYAGHGSVEVWAGSVLTSEDARTLSNGTRLPLVVAMTCLNGFFHDVFTESLAETLQKAPQGGAVAVWASSALTEPTAQVGMNQALVQRLGKGLTLGEALAQAKAAASDSDVRRSWILFGDPTTRLK